MENFCKFVMNMTENTKFLLNGLNENSKKYIGCKYLICVLLTIVSCRTDRAVLNYNIKICVAKYI